MRYLTVKNWDKFQHYKDRRPPWIKFHVSVLEDYDFSCLQDASKLLLVLLWTLAAKTENQIPDDPEWIRRQLGIKGKVNLKPLLQAGFLIHNGDASNTLADCKQSAMSETETETETETDCVPNGTLSDPATPDTDAAPLDPVKESEIRRVYLHYLAGRGLSESAYRLTPRRKQKIRTRLKDFTADALCAAIDACLASDWHMGKNDRTELFCDLADHILKSEEKVERWLQRGRGK